MISRRQEIELPEIKAQVIEYQRMAVKCTCGKVQKGKYPDHIKSTIQFGNKLKSSMVYLNVAQLIPYKRLEELSRDLLGVSISKASIENILESSTKKAGPVYQSILNIVKASTWVGSDETSKKVGIKKCWEWVWQSKDATFYAVDYSRAYHAVQTHFGETYKGLYPYV